MHTGDLPQKKKLILSGCLSRCLWLFGHTSISTWYTHTRTHSQCNQSQRMVSPFHPPSSPLLLYPLWMQISEYSFDDASRMRVPTWSVVAVTRALGEDEDNPKGGVDCGHAAAYRQLEIVTYSSLFFWLFSGFLCRGNCAPN